MLGYYMAARDLKKMDGKIFTLRRQKNGQDSLRVTNVDQIPMRYKRVEARIDGDLYEKILKQLPESCKLQFVAKNITVNAEAIKLAISQDELVPGAEVYRGKHIRVA